MRSLRSRLIVSHILPLLLVVPLVGIGLLYILQSQILLAGLSHELVRYGELSAEMAEDQPVIWSNGSEAERFVTWYSVRSHSRVMLLDRSGNLLASSHPDTDTGVGRSLQMPNLNGALAGEPQVLVNRSLFLQAEVVQVVVPVMGPNQEVLGMVRMSQHLGDLSEQFNRLRTLIIGAVLVQLVLGAVIGLVLALSLGRSLRGVTDAIYGVASGRRWETLPERGPEEIQLLLQAFNTLIEQLRLLEESRRHLLANLVHELGRPIGALQSAIQALLSGADQDPELHRELLEGMDDQVQRLVPLLGSLTDLHDQVLGSLELDLQPVALSEWLPRTVTPWREVAHDKGLHWQMEIPDSLPAVEADADRLARALGNLLSNAIKYTPEGTITVETSAQDDGVAIVVTDTGIGVAPSEQERIFEPFYRSNRDKRFPQGMGLGLSIALDLVLAHGGRLEVESEPGKGSRFTIWLPRGSADGTVAGD